MNRPNTLPSLHERAEKWLKSYERDEVALTAECLEELLQQAYLDAMETVPVELARALAFYANPDTYIAVAFAFDPPCGEFRNDFEDLGKHRGRKPGKLARKVLEEIVSKFPEILDGDDGDPDWDGP